jgi:cysteinyl-tRNA synthetase
MLKLYNTLTRKKEVFKSIKPKEVKIYSCGPTVYWYQHIGNLRTYIFSDILKRTLEYFDYNIKQVINVTDVGHLTSDADEGEDKIEKAAKKENKKAEEIAQYYFEVFEEDLHKLNIKDPWKWTKATEHVKEMIKLVQVLEKKDFTYKTSDGIYFDTSKFKTYSHLAKLKTEGLEAGKRVSIGEKQNKTDFALWKFSPENEKRQQEWPSPWGVGFPGWHIECSAMSMKYLGETLDIHTGGIDHIPVHHTNEIAQSEAATGKKFVNCWMHGAFLTIKEEKVSKSSGKIITITDLEKKDFAPLAYRYFTLTANYRSPLNFDLIALENAQNSYERLKKIISNFKDDKKQNKTYLTEFEKAISDDLDMPKALATLWKLVRDKNAQGKIKTIKEMDKVFALDLLKKEKLEISKEIKELADKREKARKEKDWKTADKLRDDIEKKGFNIQDSEEGYVLEKI